MKYPVCGNECSYLFRFLILCKYIVGVCSPPILQFPAYSHRPPSSNSELSEIRRNIFDRIIDRVGLP